MDCLDCLGGAKNVGFYDVDGDLAWNGEADDDELGVANSDTIWWIVNCPKVV